MSNMFKLGKSGAMVPVEDLEMMKYVSECASVLAGYAYAIGKDGLQLHIKQMQLGNYEVGSWTITIEKTDSEIVN